MKDQRGFTIPELLVTMGVVLVMVIGALVVLQPQSFAVEARDNQRRTDLARLAVAIQRYQADHDGPLPAPIPRSPSLLGSVDQMYNLCDVLVPRYLKDIPGDPLTGIKYLVNSSDETTLPCSDKSVDYLTSYAISQNDKGAITLTAQSAESQKISITF